LKAAEVKLKAFGSSVTAIGSSIAGLGAAAITPFLGAAKVFADAGSALADMSARTGVSVESLSALGHAAGMTGASLGDVETAVKKSQKAIVEAAKGSQEAQVALGALGLSAGQLIRLKPDEQFQAIAAAIGRIENPAAKSAAALTLFGKSGTSLIPMIDDLDALTREAKEFGLVMSGEDAEAADKLGDSLDLVAGVGGRIVQVIGAAVAPVITDLAGAIANVGKEITGWVAENKPLIATVFKVAAGIAVAGGAIAALGLAISGAGVVAGGLATGIGVVGSVLAAIVSPIGLVVAGLAGLTTWFVTSTQVGGQALGWLGERFGELRDTAGVAFQGIADALKAGDIALAGQVLWAGLKVAWLQGTAELTAIWADWGTAFKQVFADAQAAVSSIAIDAWAGLRVAWANVIADLTGSWGQMIGRLLELFSPLVTVAKQVGVDIGKTIDEGLSAIGVDPGRRGDAGAATAQIEAERQAAQEALSAQQAADTDARRAAAQQAVADAQAAVEAAKAELAGAVGEAKDKAAGAAGAAGKGSAGEFTPEGLDAGLAQARKTVDVGGSFSAAALRGVGAGNTVVDHLKDQKKESEKQTKQLEKLNDKARAGRLVFTA
jgi:hypothetical protein